MYFDEHDVVGESCGTQFDVDMMLAEPPAPAPSTPACSVALPQPRFVATSCSSSASRAENDPTWFSAAHDSAHLHASPRRRRRITTTRHAAAVTDSPIATLMEPKALAALSIVVPSSQQQQQQLECESGLPNATAMQQLRLQTPRKDIRSACSYLHVRDSVVSESPGSTLKRAKRPRSSASSSPALSSSSSSSSCASAMALARKRALKTKRTAWQSQSPAATALRPDYARVHHDQEDADQEDEDADDDDDELPPPVLSFVEYDASELDHLVLAPSQDYFDTNSAADVASQDCDRSGHDEDERLDVEPTQQQPLLQPCSFVDFRDLSQWNHESSEVFDGDTTTSTASTPFKATLRAKKENVNPRLATPAPSDSDSESSLSDGFDIPAVAMRRSSRRTARANPPPPRTSGVAVPPPRRLSKTCAPQADQSQAQWCERRSVKRDCSFIDTTCASPLVVPKCSSRARSVSRIEELRADVIESSDDVDESLTKLPDDDDDDNDGGEDSDDYFTLSGGSSSTTASASRAFRPRLLKKRRKARQLGLESFFRSRPCM